MDAPNIKFQLIYHIVSDDKNILSVSDLCDIANVSRSGYYHWVNTANLRKAREEADRADFELILDAYNYRSYKKGARGIQMRLLHLEPPIQMNVKKIRRLMKKIISFARYERLTHIEEWLRHFAQIMLLTISCNVNLQSMDQDSFCSLTLHIFHLMVISFIFQPSWMLIPNRFYPIF